MRLRRRHTIRFNQQPRPPRRDRTQAYIVASVGSAVVAWMVFSWVALQR